jgi:hypothetical protein
MGKAGILEGGKGDIMIPSAHIFEGTADNYPFKNELEKKDIEGNGINVYEGTMITVLGTSLQNKDILEFFSQLYLECYWLRNGRSTLPKSNTGSIENKRKYQRRCQSTICLLRIG